MCFSLQRAANRIKLRKVGAVSALLALDPNSAQFNGPSLTEQELCQLNRALCHVCVKLKDTQHAFVLLSWRAFVRVCICMSLYLCRYLFVSIDCCVFEPENRKK